MNFVARIADYSRTEKPDEKLVEGVHLDEGAPGQHPDAGALGPNARAVATCLHADWLHVKRRQRFAGFCAEPEKWTELQRLLIEQHPDYAAARLLAELEVDVDTGC